MHRGSPIDRPLAWLTAVLLLLAACGSQAPAATPTDDPADVAAAPADAEDPPTSDADRPAPDPTDATVRSPTSGRDPRAARVAEAPAGAQDAADTPMAQAAGDPAPTRAVTDPGWDPFATVAGIELVHPSPRVEMIGFHESNHQGARQLDVLASAVAPMTLESRDRGTGSRSAADIVVDPGRELRAPVSGVVLRAGTYVLYCDHSDDFVVIAPDARPEWEVKLLHIDGVRVAAGDRVEAGITVLAPRPTRLPFDSQVDEHSAEPSWPHVHLEVVDPSIPSGSSGSDC